MGKGNLNIYFYLFLSHAALAIKANASQDHSSSRALVQTTSSSFIREESTSFTFDENTPDTLPIQIFSDTEGGNEENEFDQFLSRRRSSSGSPSKSNISLSKTKNKGKNTNKGTASVTAAASSSSAILNDNVDGEKRSKYVSSIHLCSFEVHQLILTLLFFI